MAELGNKIPKLHLICIYLFWKGHDQSKLHIKSIIIAECILHKTVIWEFLSAYPQ